MKLKKWRTCILAALSAALILLTSCAPSVVGTGSPSSETPGGKMKCMTLENRTNKVVLMALSPVPGEFFFGEKMKPRQLKQVCYDWTPGRYMFCWTTDDMMEPRCLQFDLTEFEIERTLYDYDVDIWVEPANKKEA